MKVRRIVLLGVIVFGMQAATVEAAAQQSSEASLRGEYRRYIYAAAGAAIFGGLALLGGEGHDESPCSSTACLLSVGGGAGVVAGYMLGSDFDRKAASRRVAAPTLDRSITAIRVPGPPFRIRRLAGAELAVLQDDAISVTDGGSSVRTPLSDVRPRDVAQLPLRRAWGVASYTGLYLLPLEPGDTARLLGADPVTAVASLNGETLAVGDRDRLRRIVVSEGPGYALSEEVEIQLPGVPQAMRSSAAGTLWLLADSVLMAREPASLDSLGAVVLNGVGGELTIDGDLALIALGSSGAVVVDISDPENPAVLSSLGDMRSAMGVALEGSIGYVAAASQGLLVYDLTNPGSPVLRGVVPDLGQTVAVAALNGSVYVADRTGSRLLRIDGLPGTSGR